MQITISCRGNNLYICVSGMLTANFSNSTFEFSCSTLSIFHFLGHWSCTMYVWFLDPEIAVQIEPSIFYWKPACEKWQKLRKTEYKKQGSSEEEFLSFSDNKQFHLLFLVSFFVELQSSSLTNSFAFSTPLVEPAQSDHFFPPLIT